MTDKQLEDLASEAIRSSGYLDENLKSSIIEAMKKVRQDSHMRTAEVAAQIADTYLSRPRKDHVRKAREALYNLVDLQMEAMNYEAQEVLHNNAWELYEDYSQDEKEESDG